MNTSTQRIAVSLFAALALLGCSKKEDIPAATPTPAPVVATTAAAASGLDLDGEKTLNLYNWPDYIPPVTLAAFEKETGIKVIYDSYESNEAMHAKVVAGNTGYDIVVTGNVFAKQEIDAGLMQPLDKNRLTNQSNLDKNLMDKLNQVDGGNQHLVPWAWGFTTIGVNTTKLKKALGGLPMPDNAWDLVFNPRYTSKLKSCGIAYQDSFADIIPLALHYVGKNAGSADANDLKLAASMLSKVRRDVGLFSVGMIDDLASGKACVAIGYASEINLAAGRAKENGSKDTIEALLPQTGGIFFFDAMGILKDAKHPKNAHAFINFYLRPENAASVTNELFYPTGNSAANALLKPELIANKSLVMDAANINKLVFTGAISQEGRTAMLARFNAFKQSK